MEHFWSSLVAQIFSVDILFYILLYYFQTADLIPDLPRFHSQLNYALSSAMSPEWVSGFILCIHKPSKEKKKKHFIFFWTKYNLLFQIFSYDGCTETPNSSVSTFMSFLISIIILNSDFKIHSIKKIAFKNDIEIYS